ncbi:hypothetical protein ABEW34_22200 [Paenibacillus algorifonticola]|uniref:hypothetical protein n=1 Tax=Paenibacillus algorifonticola TaxID=684063 RepID=UPI003D2CF2CD
MKQRYYARVRETFDSAEAAAAIEGFYVHSLYRKFTVLYGIIRDSQMPLITIFATEGSRLASRKGELTLEVTRHFTRAEGELPIHEQQQLFKADMLIIVDLLEEKLRKKKLNYRVDLLRLDLIDILEKWTTRRNAT